MRDLRSFVAVAVAGLLFLSNFALQASVNNITSKVMDDRPLILGVFPFLPPRELEKIFAPFAASLGVALGKEILFESANSYQNFMERSDAQLYDIAFVQPFDYVRLADEFNYVPLATRGGKLASVIVVRENSQIKSVMDLRGKVIAAPPSVAAVTRLAMDFLRKYELLPGLDIRILRQRSHASCLQQVLIQAAEACITAMPPVQFMQRKMKVKFKVIARTRGIPHTLFIAHKRLSEQQRDKIIATILSWSETEAGKKMLRRGAMKSFTRIKDVDYDVVRNIAKNASK